MTRRRCKGSGIVPCVNLAIDVAPALPYGERAPVARTACHGCGRMVGLARGAIARHNEPARMMRHAKHSCEKCPAALVNVLFKEEV